MFDKFEPTNSWEISFVISLKKAHINLGINPKIISQKLSLDRKRELIEWANDNFTHQWFLAHI